MPLVWTQADLDAGKAAILQAMQGKTVSFGDRSWSSQDLKDLLAFVASIQTAVTGTSGSRLAAFSKGLSS
jgi:hypothetical protein